MCSHLNRLIEAILMSTHYIPYQYKKRKSTEIIPNTIIPAAMGCFFILFFFFDSDSRRSSKQPW